MRAGQGEPGPGRTPGACLPRQDRFAAPSVILDQVHAGVERCDLFGITIESQGLHPVAEKIEAVAGDASLRALAPARMADVRIDVRIEPVFLGRGLVP